MIDPPEKFWETTYKQNIGKMTGICYRYVGNRQIAEDLAHDAFLTSMNKSADFEGKGPFEGWLRRIVVNVALQYLRQQKRKKYLEDWIAYTMTDMETREDDLAGEEFHYFSEKELLEAIDELPEHHKLVFNLYVIDKFTHAQIGSELGISEGTSKSHLARARKKIRAVLVQHVKETRKDDKRKYAFFLLISFKSGGVDRLYRKSFSDFELQPWHFRISDEMNFSEIPSPRSGPAASYPGNFLKIGLMAGTMGIAAFFAVNLPGKQPSADAVSPGGIVIKPAADSSALFMDEKAGGSESQALTPPNLTDIQISSTDDNNLIFSDSSDATIMKKGIISENIQKIENMKKLNTIGALLLAGASLAPDSMAQAVHKPGILFSRDQSLELTNGLEMSRIKPSPKDQNESGTFFASSVTWSGADNELYLKGKTIVRFGGNNFMGDGTFTFLGKVHYLVFEGTPAEINSSIQLKEKKYAVRQLSFTAAQKKYGEKGRQGAVEIELAE